MPAFWTRLLHSVALGHVFCFNLWQILHGPVFRYFLQDRGAADLFFSDTVLWILAASVIFYALLSSQYKTLFFWVSGLTIVHAVGVIAWSWRFGWFQQHHAAAIAVGVPAVIGFFFVWFRFTAFYRAVLGALSVWLIFGVYSLLRVLSQIESLPVTTPVQRDHIAVTSISRGKLDASKNPIIWILFDELDQKIAFESSGAPFLPNLQLFRSESLNGTEAVPTSYWTLAAIPSMLTGRLYTVFEAEEPSPSSHLGRYWAATPNLFSELHNRRRSTAVAGWYHPYCAVLQPSPDECFTAQWESPTIEQYTEQAPFSERTPALLNTLLSYPSSDLETLSLEARTAHRKMFEAIMNQLPRLLPNPAGFTLIHLPVPHIPGISLQNGTPSGGYLENLVLADTAFGQIRSILEKTSNWERSTVLVTGDHQLRLRRWGKVLGNAVTTLTGGKEDPRTIFLLKLPKTQVAASYKKAFNLVLIHDLILELDAGNLTNSDDILLWLDKNRSRFHAEAPSF